MVISSVPRRNGRDDTNEYVCHVSTQKEFLEIESFVELLSHVVFELGTSLIGDGFPNHNQKQHFINHLALLKVTQMNRPLSFDLILAMYRNKKLVRNMYLQLDHQIAIAKRTGQEHFLHKVESLKKWFDFHHSPSNVQFSHNKQTVIPPKFIKETIMSSYERDIQQLYMVLQQLHQNRKSLWNLLFTI